MHQPPDFSPAAVARFRTDLARRVHLRHAQPPAPRAPTAGPPDGLFETHTRHRLWEHRPRLPKDTNALIQPLLAQKARFTDIGWGDGSEAAHGLVLGGGFLLTISYSGDVEVFNNYRYSEEVDGDDGAYIFGPDDIRRL